MGLFKKIAKDMEKGKQEARQEVAGKAAKREAFNKKMDQLDAKEERLIVQAEEARQRGDDASYSSLRREVDRVRKDIETYPDPD
jgi:hypothetical protein